MHIAHCTVCVYLNQCSFYVYACMWFRFFYMQFFRLKNEFDLALNVHKKTHNDTMKKKLNGI